MILAQTDPASGRVLVATMFISDDPHIAPLQKQGWVEWSQATFDQHLANKGSSRYVAGKLEALAEERPIEQARDRAASKVDVAAEQARSRFATPGSGQALEYQETAAEAQALARTLAAGLSYSPTDYPWLAAEQRATGQPIAAIVAAVLQKRAAWVQAMAAIKEIRRRAKVALAAAATQDEIDAVLAGLRWPGHLAVLANPPIPAPVPLVPPEELQVNWVTWLRNKEPST